MIVSKEFQSTHPRRVRLESTRNSYSISCYFNPHTREGCDLQELISLDGGLIDFNPHTREGCDHLSKIPLYKLKRISIHTPAKGATLLWTSRPGRYANFNPHTREGCDSSVDFKTWEICKFQSTHPRRVRPKLRSLPLRARLISIHTLAKGATLFWVLVPPGEHTFQSTHPRRVRRFEMTNQDMI